MRTIVFFLAALLSSAAAAPASQRSVVVTLGAMNGSGESGTATFTEQGDKTLVVVGVSNAPAQRQPSHLHAGSCDDYTPRPAYPLADVVNGTSRTLLPQRFDVIVSGKYILNIHKSYDDIATQAACGAVKP